MKSESLLQQNKDWNDVEDTLDIEGILVWIPSPTKQGLKLIWNRS